MNESDLKAASHEISQHCFSFRIFLEKRAPRKWHLTRTSCALNYCSTPDVVSNYVCWFGWRYNMKTCPSCGGSGKGVGVRERQSDGWVGTTETTCPRCSGSGMVPDTGGSGGGGSGGGGSSCLAAETAVHTPAGWKAIADFKVGDEISSFDRRQGSITQREVKRVIRSGVGQIWEVRTKRISTVIRATWGHPLMTTRGMRNIWRLKPGDVLLSPSGDNISNITENPVVSIKVTDAYLPVFNLRTTGEFNYILNGAISPNFGVAPSVRKLFYRAWDLLSPPRDEAGIAFTSK